MKCWWTEDLMLLRVWQWEELDGAFRPSQEVWSSSVPRMSRVHGGLLMREFMLSGSLVSFGKSTPFEWYFAYWLCPLYKRVSLYCEQNCYGVLCSSTCALWMILVGILVAMHWIYSTMYILYMRACTVTIYSLDAVHQMLSDSKIISVFDTQSSTTFHLEHNPCPFPCILGGTRQLGSESCHKRSCCLHPLVGHSNTTTVVKKTVQWQYLCELCPDMKWILLSIMAKHLFGTEHATSPRSHHLYTSPFPFVSCACLL